MDAEYIAGIRVVAHDPKEQAMANEVEKFMKDALVMNVNGLRDKVFAAMKEMDEIIKRHVGE